MIGAESFLTASLRAHPHGAAIARILAASLQAVEPGEAVRRFVRREGSSLSVAGTKYDLAEFRNIYLLGIGKAAAGMAAPLVELLAERLASGLLLLSATSLVPTVDISHAAESAHWHCAESPARR